MVITAEKIVAAIKAADSEKNQADGIGWLDADDLRRVVIDGRIDMVRVAEIIAADVDPAQ